MAERIVFIGAGPVALASLEALYEHFEIELVVTKPDPKSSRAPRLISDFAIEHNLDIIKPENQDELTKAILELNLDSLVGVVVDYGIIINQAVIDYFELGIVNSHFSLLPKWRGADPITFALLSGESETGVSLMVINPELDEGDLIVQEPYQIEEHETIISLTNNLVALSNRLLVENLPKYLEGTLRPFPQNSDIEPSYSRKLTKVDGQIDWNKSAEQLDREIRAYLGWPGSKTTLNNTEVTITQAYPAKLSEKLNPGEVKVADKKMGLFFVACGEGALYIQKLKPAGKAEMDAIAFINGYLKNN